MNVNDTNQDTRNQYGVIKCGHCGKPGHGMANCWELHGKPENMGANTMRGRALNRLTKRCWNCGGTDHLAYQCPKLNNTNEVTFQVPTNNNNNNNNDNDNDNINSLFIGGVTHLCTKVIGRNRVKSRLISGESGSATNDEESWCELNPDDKDEGDLKSSFTIDSS